MGQIILGDALEELRKLPSRSVDLVMTSPPYENCRTYGIDFNLEKQQWVDWLVPIVKESLRVCEGLVAFVVEGKTRHFSWSGTPVLLMADLIRAGVTLRKPPIYERDGIPGSGGPDWWKNRYEFVVCATNGGRLAWSDNTACGHPPVFGPGGQMSYRGKDGSRVSQTKGGSTAPKVMNWKNGDRPPGSKLHSKRRSNGAWQQVYIPPEKANPGNIIDCGPCGGGKLGSDLAHENEAPFPEKLVEPFILSFCPPAYCHVCGCVVGFHNERRICDGTSTCGGGKSEKTVAGQRGSTSQERPKTGQSNREFVSHAGQRTQSPAAGAKTCPHCGAIAVYPGTVLDPFGGSGTTAAVAEKHGRNWISIDIRPGQIDLMHRRLREVRGTLPMPKVSA